MIGRRRDEVEPGDRGCSNILLLLNYDGLKLGDHELTVDEMS